MIDSWKRRKKMMRVHGWKTIPQYEMWYKDGEGLYTHELKNMEWKEFIQRILFDKK